VPLNALFGAQAAHAHDELAHLAHDHLHEDRIDSVVIPVPAPLLMDKLTSFLKSDAMKDVYRAKGFVQMQGEAGFSLFNFVPRRYGLERSVNTSLRDDEGFVVFIGRDVTSREALLKSELEHCAA
jgi:G3E family GTPase